MNTSERVRFGIRVGEQLHCVGAVKVHEVVGYLGVDPLP
jgi:hypothetical protein